MVAVVAVAKETTTADHKEDKAEKDKEDPALLQVEIVGADDVPSLSLGERSELDFVFVISLKAKVSQSERQCE